MLELPVAGCVVEDAAQLGVDVVARRERLLERDPADHDVDDRVVFGDHRLRREGHDLLAEVAQRAEPIDEGHDQREPR